MSGIIHEHRIGNIDFKCIPVNDIEFRIEFSLDGLTWKKHSGKFNMKVSRPNLLKKIARELIKGR